MPMPNSSKNADRNSGSEPKLLSGGNPQIPKGEGDRPVRAYIAAMPGWKRSVGERLDGLIVRTVADVHKAVKWNQPFYGHEGDGWFLTFRCYRSSDERCLSEASVIARRTLWTTDERADRPCADCCFAVAEQSSQEAAPAQLVLSIPAARTSGTHTPRIRRKRQPNAACDRVVPGVSAGYPLAETTSGGRVRCELD
jgi:hypothetical protein